MSDRPADTMTPLANYLWWLLPEFLKKKDRADSLVARFCEVWGSTLEAARSTLVEIVPLQVVETATGAWLDQLARGRQIFRSDGESDESLRTRVLSAHEIKRKAGTIPGMENGLAAIGYGVEVEEPFHGTDIWSRFLVHVYTWDGLVADQGFFHSAVRLLKPAHTRALIEPHLLLATWDDWEFGAPPNDLDIGQLDDWQPTP